MKDERWIGWHFLPEDGRFRWGSKKPVKVGERRSCKDQLILCVNGLHASKRLIDALYYAPGPIICKVELSGEIVEGGDKACARYRTVIAMADATKELHLFACWCAAKALKAANITDDRCWNAIRTKKRWLRGLATDEELCAAWNAARDAAREVGRDAAREAAWSAGWDTAWSAAWNAGWGVARGVDWDVAQSAQNTNLTRRINKLLKMGRAGRRIQ